MDPPPPSSPPRKSDTIIVVGAGIFGLSTALHLAERGYSDVTVFDKQPYDRMLYSYFAGCDGASADLNKIVRCAYGRETVYQELAFESLEGWKTWNAELAAGGGVSGVDRVFVNNGHLAVTEGPDVPQFELDSIAGMEQAGHPDSILVVGDERQREIARKKGFGFAIDPFDRVKQAKSYVGVLDTTGGVAFADKGCRLALHKAQAAGVKFVLDAEAGALESLVYYGSGESREKVMGIKTRDGKTHPAAIVVLACGGWTPALLPVMDGLCETTAGSVAMFKLPRESSLWEKLSPENFPTWSWNMRAGAEGGLYGFPRDEEGWFKIGYRGTKYTNPVVQADGKERSVPLTRWTEESKIKTVPEQALKVIWAFLDEYLPQLRAEGIDVAMTRLCWYTDSFDNHLVIDWVPGLQGLMVATGGSGHAFKYLPAVGKWVVDIMEGVGLDRQSVKAWKWRSLGQDEKPYNVLMEGSQGPRALGNVVLAPESAKTGI